MSDSEKLFDQHGRIHNYLRVSLTDACNFRCQYCVASFGESHHVSPHLMQADEIYGIIKVFAELGVERVRFTGGEPLVRKDVGEIFNKVKGLPLKFAITTNGMFLDKYLDHFKDMNLKSINVSLDTLDAAKFKYITKVDALTKVVGNIEKLLHQDFYVKVNAVVMRGVNDDEILDFVELTKSLPIHVRFIEFMPFKNNEWDQEKVYSYQEILNRISSQYHITKLVDERHDTAKKYQVQGHEGTFAVISTVTEPFCSDCNRIRLTADGKMKNCLFSQSETDILAAYRNGEDIKPLIIDNIKSKFPQFGGQKIGKEMNNRSMIMIGG